MDSHAAVSRRCLRSAVQGAKAITTLPAVPTPDWCDRAAAALLLPDRTSAAMVALCRLNPEGAVTKVESVGVAASMVAEVTTRVGRLQAESAPVGLDSSHQGLTLLRNTALSQRPMGWSPRVMLFATGESTAAMPAEQLGATEGDLLRERWAEGLGLGRLRVLVGAAWLGSQQHSRAVLVEMGVGVSADMAGGGGGADLGEAAALLDVLIPALAQRAVLAFDPGQPLADQHLTLREEMVLRRLLEGKSVRQIAEELGRSPHTVHDHVKSLHRKLGASTRGALVARALGHLKAGGAETEAPARTPVQGEVAARPS